MIEILKLGWDIILQLYPLIFIVVALVLGIFLLYIVYRVGRGGPF